MRLYSLLLQAEVVRTVLGLIAYMQVSRMRDNHICACIGFAFCGTEHSSLRHVHIFTVWAAFAKVEVRFCHRHPLDQHLPLSVVRGPMYTD